ncbi:protein of unassigned function [Methylobacterium oryzae CBMB20]|uniref:Protein of unassigned function n=1 Tax=Methylobacterium oryzae CBMB20 TaxID=693986 RepID=A0A089P186_9HYPH|nr:protein of unassigned function [Methylobacterium oryzae CBMB20]
MDMHTLARRLARRMPGAEHLARTVQGAARCGEPQKGLKQQRVERDQANDRAPSTRSRLPPAHGAIYAAGLRRVNARVPYGAGRPVHRRRPGGARPDETAPHPP